MIKTILIDADVVAFRFAAAHEDVTQWTDDVWTSSANLTEAHAEAVRFCEKVRDEVGATDMVLLFSGSDSYRKDVFPKYKSNRKGKRRPLILKQLRDALLERPDAYLAEHGIEADDMLGLLGYRNLENVIATIDKDLKTVECNFYNWDYPDDGVILTDAKAAATQFYTQVLTGDSVDGYPGCPGVGPKTADKLLQGAASAEEMWDIVVATYAKKKLTEDDAIVQARMAYILKAPGDYCPTAGVNLWTP